MTKTNGTPTVDNEATTYAGDFVVGLTVFLYCLYIAWSSFSLSPRARIFPLFIVICLAAVALWHALAALRRSIGHAKRRSHVPGITARLLTMKNIYPLIVAAIAFCYPPLMERIGFEISSVLFLFALMILVERTVTWVKLGISIVVPTLLYLMFSYGLQLQLPLFVSRFIR